MKAGDLVMYCDGHSNVEPVLLIKLCDPSDDTEDEALVMNEFGQHWVLLDNLVPIDGALELLCESW